MIDSKEMISSILKATQLSQLKIKSILKCSICSGLRECLEYQLQEYRRIEMEAHVIASQRGWETPELDPAQIFLSETMMKIRSKQTNADSKIAAMIILENTKMMMNCIKYIHRFQKNDDQIRMLFQRFQDCMSVNIRHMQAFL